MSRYLVTLISVTIGLSHAMGHSLAQDRGDLAPVGQRQYLIDQSPALVRIEPDGGKSKSLKQIRDEGSEVLMRDPILPSDGDGNKMIQPEVLAPKQEIPESIPARLTFRHKAILGRYAVPKVSFGQDILPVPRADREIQLDPIRRIFKTDREIERW